MEVIEFSNKKYPKFQSEGNAPHIIKCFLEDNGMKNILVSGIDLNNSFMIVCEK